MKRLFYNLSNYSKTVIFNDNKIEIVSAPLIGKETILYNNTPVPAIGSFGGVTNVFVTVEQERYVQYDVELTLRWHCLGFYTTVRRQNEIIYTDK